MVVTIDIPAPCSIISVSLMIISMGMATFPDFIHSQSQNDTSYEDCSPFKCGNLTFSFPFSSSSTSGYCGLPNYQIICDSSSVPKLLLSGRLYQVRNFFSSQDDRLITVVDTQLIKDLSSGSCESLYNLSVAINSSYSIGSLTLPSGRLNFTFFKCPRGLYLPKNFTNKVVSNVSCNDGHVLHLWRNRNQSDRPPFDPVSAPSGCDSVVVPVSSVTSLYLGADVFDTLRQGFSLEWPKLDDCEKCQNRSGRCGYNGSLKKITCFCKGGRCDSVKLVSSSSFFPPI